MPADSAADVRNNSRWCERPGWPRGASGTIEAVSAGDFQRPDPDGRVDAERKGFPLEHEDSLPGFLELREAHGRKEADGQDHLTAAAEHEAGRGAGDRFEALRGSQLDGASVEEPAP